MSSPDLKAMARWLESSNPSDRDEQAWLLTRINELRDSIADELDADLYACLQACVHLLEALSGPSEHFPCDIVGATVKSLINSIDASLSARANGAAVPAPSAPLPVAEATLPVAEVPPPARTPELKFDAEPASKVIVDVPTDIPGAAASQPVLQFKPELEPQPTPDLPNVVADEIQIEWPEETPAAESGEAAVPTEEFPECNDEVLGKMLIALGHVTREQVASALRLHREKKLRLGECLLLQGATTPDRVLNTLKIQDSMRGAKNAEEDGQHFEVEVTRTPLRRPMPKKSDGPPPKPAALHVTEKMFIGEVLLGAEMITNEQLEEAMHRHHHDGVRVGEALVLMGALTEKEIQSGLALHESLRHIAGLTASSNPRKR